MTPPRTIPQLNVAITGGIGAGKSEALRAFARQGAATASADEIVHRLYADPEVQQSLVEREALKLALQVPVSSGSLM